MHTHWTYVACISNKAKQIKCKDLSVTKIFAAKFHQGEKVLDYLLLHTEVLLVDFTTSFLFLNTGTTVWEHTIVWFDLYCTWQSLCRTLNLRHPVQSNVFFFHIYIYIYIYIYITFVLDLIFKVCFFSSYRHRYLYRLLCYKVTLSSANHC